MRKAKESSTSHPAYDLSDVEHLLARVPTTTGAILVGGQAINFWATRYADTLSAILNFRPFTSVDIDFMAGTRLAKQWARAIGAKLVLPDTHDHVAINTAKLIVPTPSTRSLELDFLAAVDGVDVKRARESAHVVTSEDGQIEFSVLHPFHCLQSVLANAYGRQRRRDQGAGLGERARDRCKLAALICRAYLVETIKLYRVGAANIARPYDLIEHVGYIAMLPNGLAAFAEDEIDVLDIVDPTHPQLTADFRTRRWPALAQDVAMARAGYKPGRIIARKRPKM